jgi:hypothetical protein
LVAHTARTRIIRMSISGRADRDSTRTHSAPTTTATTSRPMTAGEPQPQDGAWLTASSSATSQPDSSRAAGQLIEPDVRTGDSGTRKCAASAETTSTISGSQNSQW